MNRLKRGVIVCRLPLHCLLVPSFPTNHVAAAEEASVTKPAFQNDLSLARDDWLFQAHRHEVNAPDLSFRGFRKPESNRVQKRP